MFSSQLWKDLINSVIILVLGIVQIWCVRDIFQTGAQFKDTKATLRIVIYKNIKKIDVEVDLNAYMGENWREYRLAFPLNEAYSKVIYDVPMGVLEVGKDEMEGKAGHKGLQPSYDVVCSSVHPREIQDWFGAYGNDRGFTIGSDVAVFDWVNIFDTLSMAKVLQPVLISNRKAATGKVIIIFRQVSIVLASL